MSQTPKKFALIGTSCIGKTTLLMMLEEKLTSEKPKKKIAIVPEAARIYFSTRKVRKPFSVTNQSAVQKLAKTQEELALQTNPDIILSDRSVLDAYMYVKALSGEDNAQPLLHRVKGWLPSYTHLFLLDPKGVPYQTDTVRKEQESIREQFHKTFVASLPKLAVSFSLIDGTLEQRLHKMLQIIHS